MPESVLRVRGSSAQQRKAAKGESIVGYAHVVFPMLGVAACVKCVYIELHWKRPFDVSADTFSQPNFVPDLHPFSNFSSYPDPVG